MYRSYVLEITNEAQKNPLKKQSYSNENIFNQKNVPCFSKVNESTDLLQNLLGTDTSFAQFISDEKYNLQFFPSFKGTRDIINNQKKNKSIIRNVYSLPCNVSNKYYLPLANLKVIYDGTGVTSKTQFSNIAFNILSTASTLKKVPYVENILAYQPINMNTTNKMTHMHCVEPHANHMNDEPTKADQCFILQLNTYIDQTVVSPRKQPNIQTKKIDASCEEAIESQTDSALKFNGINISTQLSYNTETDLNENDVLLRLYNQPIVSSIRSSMKKEDGNKMFGNGYYLAKSQSKMEDDDLDHIEEDLKRLLKNGRWAINTSSEFRQEASVSVLMKSLENTEMKDSNTNQMNSLDIRQPLTIGNSLTTNSQISHSSIARRNASEFADREQHLVEVIELPRSSHRLSRMKIYTQVHKQLTVENLIDIDLAALLPTVLQSIS